MRTSAVAYAGLTSGNGFAKEVQNLRSTGGCCTETCTVGSFNAMCDRRRVAVSAGDRGPGVVAFPVALSSVGDSKAIRVNKRLRGNKGDTTAR